MTTKKDLVQLLGATDGPKYWTNVKNRNRGGEVNEKGNTYENFFATHKIAELISVNKSDLKKIVFSSQKLFFVDDLIIDNKVNNKRSYFQLKNAKYQSWGNGKLGTLHDDFRVQILLDPTCKCHLVLSKESLQKKLKKEVPKKIKKNTEVVFFAYDPNLNIVLSKNKLFYLAIKKLCVTNEVDKIESVATILLGTWVGCGKKNITLKSILEKSINSSPSFIKPLGMKFALKASTKSILNQIKNFTYNINNGFLVWNYGNGLQTGILEYSCGTEKFKKFEALLKLKKPSDFDSLEPFLL